MLECVLYNRHGACDEDIVHQLIDKWRLEVDDIIEFNLTYGDNDFIFTCASCSI